MYENISYEEILDRMLDRIPDTMDKREGSVIYDALAPAAIELQLMYIELENTINESFADTASREYLIKRAAERGLYPYPATKAILKGIFTPTDLEISSGDRFNLDELNYCVKDKIGDGEYALECEEPGTNGNGHFGDLIPIEYIDGLETAKIIELLIPGEDEEDVEIFRQRYFDSFNAQAFGGNVADYKTKTIGISGVRQCKVYPVWNGGGTVKVVIMDSDYNKPSESLISSVQETLDPTQNQGAGLGIAPIGHVVTVEGVVSKTINILSTITFASGYDINSAIASIRDAIDKYFLSLRKDWQNQQQLVVRISQIEYNLLDCSEVLDIADTTINGMAKNYILGENEIPQRGTINGI